MPKIYEVEAPDGSILEIEGPDDATDEQVAAFAAQQFGQSQAAPPVMERKAFEQELLRRIRETDETPDAIRAWAESVRQPAVNNAAQLTYGLGPNAAAEIETIRRQPNVPTTVINADEPTSALGGFGRGTLDALTFNFGDELTAGLETGFGLAGDYDAAVQEQRILRAQDDPIDRGFGEALGIAATLPFAPSRLLNAPTMVGRAARAAGAGAAGNVLYGQGAATEEAPANIAEDIIVGGTLGAAVPVAGAAAGAAVRGVRNLASDNAAAIQAIRELGVSPAVLRQEYQAAEKALGRKPALGEVLGQVGERLRPALARAPEQRYAADELARQAQNELMTGVRARVGDVDPEEAARLALMINTRRVLGEGDVADQAAEQLRAGVQQRLGSGDFVPQAEENLRRGLREQVAPMEAKGREVLDAERRLLDRQNYGALTEIQTPVGQEEIGRVNKFISKIGLDAEDAAEIRARMNAGFITADDYERIRRGLQGQVELRQLSRAKYAERVAELDSMFDEFLPQVAAARRASFEARSLVEGSRAGQAAVRDLGAQPVSQQQRMANLSPERQAGLAPGAALAVQDLTSDAAKAVRFAESAVNNADYQTVLRQALPPTIADGLINMARAGTAQIAEVSALGLKNVGADAKKAYALANRLVNDQKFVESLRRVLPDQVDDLKAFAVQHKDRVDSLRRLDLEGVGDDINKAYKLAERIARDPKVAPEIRRLLPKKQADDLISFATQQKEQIDRLSALGLSNVSKDVGQSYRFAERLSRDPAYAREVAAAIPGQAGADVVQFAQAQKKAVDSLMALAGVPQSSVGSVLDNVEESAKAAVVAATGGGAAIKASLINNVIEKLGVGQGAARRLAELLFEPAQFDRVIAQLEKRGFSESRVATAMRDALILTAAQANNDNTRTPAGVVTVQ